jgi:hypothetical protein
MGEKMKNNISKNYTLERDEIEELIVNIHKNNQIKLFIFGISLAIAFSFKMGNLQVSWTVLGLTAFLFFLNVISEFLVKKVWVKQNLEEVTQGYFIFQAVELMALLLLIYFLGALLFWGIAVLIMYITFCFLIFTRKTYPWVIALLATAVYFALALLEYFGILPYMNIYHLEKKVIQKPSFLIPTFAFTAGLLITLAFYLDIFSKSWEDSFKELKLKLREIREKEEKLAQIKENLEEKLKEKEREIRELTLQFNQERHLREKEAQRLKELETFHKLAVERELKMKELKEEIGRLKKLIKSK